MATPLNLSIASPRYTVSPVLLFPQRNLTLRRVVSALSSSYVDSSVIGIKRKMRGFSSRSNTLPQNLVRSNVYPNPRCGLHNGMIEARKGNPPIMPAVVTPGGPLDLTTVLLRSRIIFIGQPINSQVAQRVISQLVTLAAIDEESDIMIYLNCPGGSTYSVLAIYDCMSWIKPNVGTLCFGTAASQGALLLAGGQKGMRYAMPNARILINQPQSGFGGHVEDVRRQANEAAYSRNKIDKMYAAFTEAIEFGLVDGVLETEY
ncbi:hypothetical protein OROGR_017932 [Orobanche gracilis]